MTPTTRPRAAVAAFVSLAVAGGLLVPDTTAGAQSEVGERVRELEHRGRSLTVRTESLDGAERSEQTEDERTVTLDADVLFEFDEDDLDADAQDRLDELAADLEELGPREVAISGHTDNQGSTSYNQDLSERRAESVQTALAGSLGDDFEFDVTGHGQDEPVADNETEEGQALNRRVEIQFSTD